MCAVALRAADRRTGMRRELGARVATTLQPPERAAAGRSACRRSDGARSSRGARADLRGALAQPVHELALGFGGVARDAAGQLAGAAAHDPVVARGLPDAEVLGLGHLRPS